MAERFKVTKAEQAAGLDEEAAVTGKLLSSEKHQGKLGRAGRTLRQRNGPTVFWRGFCSVGCVAFYAPLPAGDLIYHYFHPVFGYSPV